jgi:hypothetical protein
MGEMVDNETANQTAKPLKKGQKKEKKKKKKQFWSSRIAVLVVLMLFL